MSPSSPSVHGIALVLLAAVLWGTTGTAHSFAPAGLPAFWVGALRLVMAAAFFALLGWALQRGRDRRAPAARRVPLPWPQLLLCAACMVTYNMAFFAGLQRTGVGLGTTVAIGSSPVWAGLLQALWQRRLPHGLWWLGTGVGVVGGAAMAWGKGGPMEGTLAGLLLCLLAGLAYGAYAVLSQPLVLRCGVTRVNVWVFVGAALLSLPMAAWLGGGLPQSGVGARGWAVVVYLGVVATGLAYLCFSIGLRTVSAATSVALSKFEPITAFLLAIAVVGERPTSLAFAGLALVLLGLWMVVYSEMHSAGPADPA